MRKLEPREYALYLLKLRDRSVGEIRKKMEAKRFDQEVIAGIISDLASKNLVNDERFASDFVRQRMTGKPHGKHWFEQKLYEKQISKDIIERTLREIPCSKQLIDNAIERWLSRHIGAEKNDLYVRLAPYLVRQGFDYDEVKEAINRLK